MTQVLEAGSTKMETPPLNLTRSRRPLRARLARWGVMLVIFLAGGVAGYSIGTVRFFEYDVQATGVLNQPDKFTEYLLGKLKVDLSLTETQYPEVAKVIVRHHEAFEKIKRQTQPLFEKEMAQLEREMQSILTPTQWKRYKEQLDRMRNRFRRGPPPPGGPGRGGPGRDYRGPGFGHGDRSHDGKRPPRDSSSSGRPEQDAPKTESPLKVEPAKAAPAAEQAVESKPSP